MGGAPAGWLRALNLPANRHRLWSNLRSIALGLEILHNEGLKVVWTLGIPF